MRLFSYRTEHEKKNKMRLPLSAYLLYLLVATLLFTGASFSRFATSQSISGSARVAIVELDASIIGEEKEELAIDTTSDVFEADYDFYVTNLDSEVALKYSIIVTLPEDKALPEGLSMKLVYDDEECTYEKSDNVYTFNGGANFPAGEEQTHNYTLIFTGTSDLVESDTIAGISVSVTAEQID